MIDQVSAIYTIIDDALKLMHHREDPRRSFTDAEVITTGLVASRFFGGHLNHARAFLHDTRLMPQMLGASRFNRRWHACADLVQTLLESFGWALKAADERQQYLLDSFPLAVCHNVRIPRCRLLSGAEFHGYCVAKREYFYGYRVHVVTTTAGAPVELAFLPGHANDVRGLGVVPFALPTGSEVFMDAGYTDYQDEDAAWEADGLRFAVARKRNSRRRDGLAEFLFKQITRHDIETVFSELTSWFPKRIHAVTAKGFLLKATLFVFAFALSKAFI
jgi:hypothetical protein